MTRHQHYLDLGFHFQFFKRMAESLLSKLAGKTKTGYQVTQKGVVISPDGDYLGSLIYMPSGDNALTLKDQKIRITSEGMFYVDEHYHGFLEPQSSTNNRLQQQQPAFGTYVGGRSSANVPTLQQQQGGRAIAPLQAPPGGLHGEPLSSTLAGTARIRTRTRRGVSGRTRSLRRAVAVAEAEVEAVGDPQSFR
jgi:hypothetical protein